MGDRYRHAGGRRLYGDLALSDVKDVYDMSDNATIRATEAIEWFAEIFETSENEISTETKREDIEGWDSMGVLTLMAELDDRFSITLSQDELENIDSINDLLDVLKKNDVLADS